MKQLSLHPVFIFTSRFFLPWTHHASLKLQLQPPNHLAVHNHGWTSGHMPCKLSFHWPAGSHEQQFVEQVGQHGVQEFLQPPRVVWQPSNYGNIKHLTLKTLDRLKGHPTNFIFKWWIHGKDFVKRLTFISEGLLGTHSFIIIFIILFLFFIFR